MPCCYFYLSPKYVALFPCKGEDSGESFIYMKASDLFVKILENKGVDTIYGVPGEENLDLLDSI